MNDLKPGIKSSEFYATLAVMIVALLVIFGVVDPAEEQELAAALTDLLAALAALVSAAHVVARYIQGRTTLKLRHLEERPAAVETVER